MITLAKLRSGWSIPSGRWLRRCASIVLTLLYGWALWRLSSQLSWSTLGEALRIIDKGWLALTIGLVALGQALRVLRWTSLLGWQAVPPWRTTLQAVWGGQIINWLVPVRGGDLWRIWRMYRTDRHTLWWTAGSIVVEKSLDALIMASLAGSLFFLPTPPGLPVVGTRIIATVLVGVLAGGAVLALQPRHWQQRLAKRWPQLGTWLAAKPGSAHQPVELGRIRRWLPIIALTLAVWLVGLTTNALLAQAFGLPVGLTTHIVLILALQLGIVVPSLPANLGVFPLICAGVLGSVGIGTAQAVAYGSVLYLVVYGVMLSMWLLTYLPFVNLAKSR